MQSGHYVISIEVEPGKDAHLASGHRKKAIKIPDKVFGCNQSEKNGNWFTFSGGGSEAESCKPLQVMVGDIGLEPITPCL